MMRTVEAVIEADGHVRFLEPVQLGGQRRALITLLDDADDTAGENSSALLAEAALSDWNTDEEDAAWAHLQ